MHILRFIFVLSIVHVTKDLEKYFVLPIQNAFAKSKRLFMFQLALLFLSVSIKLLKNVK